MAAEYNKLNKTIDYDKGAVEELADAMTELRDLKSREAYLLEIINENKELHAFVWMTAECEMLPHHKIEDDHLKNIYKHLIETGRKISKELRSEGRKRGLVVPANNQLGAPAPNTLGGLIARTRQIIESEDFTDTEDMY